MGQFYRVRAGHLFSPFLKVGEIIWQLFFLNHSTVFTDGCDWTNVGHPVRLLKNILVDSNLPVTCWHPWSFLVVLTAPKTSNFDLIWCQGLRNIIDSFKTEYFEVRKHWNYTNERSPTAVKLRQVYTFAHVTKYYIINQNLQICFIISGPNIKSKNFRFHHYGTLFFKFFLKPSWCKFWQKFWIKTSCRFYFYSSVLTVLHIFAFPAFRLLDFFSWVVFCYCCQTLSSALFLTEKKRLAEKYPSQTLKPYKKCLIGSILMNIETLTIGNILWIKYVFCLAQKMSDFLMSVFGPKNCVKKPIRIS